MFRKKKEKFNLYLDEIDYVDSEDDLLDEELLDDDLLEEDIDDSSLQISDHMLMDDMDPDDQVLTEEESIDQDLPPAETAEDDFSDDLALMEAEGLYVEAGAEDDLSDAGELYAGEDDYLLDEGELYAGTGTGEEEPAEEESEDKKTGKKGLFGKKKGKNKKSGKKKKAKFGRSGKKGAKKFLFGKKKKEEMSVPEGYLPETKKKLSPKKIAAIAAAAVFVIGIAIFFIVRNLGGGDDSKAYVESVGDLTGLGSANGMSNRYTGEVEAQDSWKITLQQDLSVSECYVSVGDEVKKGDKLFSYNTEQLKLNKEKKELEVESLTLENKELTKTIADNQKDLKSANATEKIELQTAILTNQTKIKSNEFTIKSSKQEIKALEKNIKDATVKSKMAGLVKSINSSLGKPAGEDSDDSSSSDDGSEGNVYMTILALGDYRVKGKISETNVWQINEGDPVIVRSRVDDQATWTGTIEKVKTDSNVNSESQNSSDVEYDTGNNNAESATSYYFYVKLDSDEGLMLGQHVLVEQDKGQDSDKEGMWLNSAYLHKDGKKFYVWAANSRNRLTLRRIKVGKYDEDLDEYEILDGLSITDYIASDSDSLHENMKITKVNTETGEDYLDEEQNDDTLYNDSEGSTLTDGNDMTESIDGDGSGDQIIDDGSGLGADVLDDAGDSGQNNDGANDDGLVTID
ncbi:MAG: efflux RND transporter periplasmic adaptor subunit [Eubacterium sp.]|nr:efflux RND transporter periplasmic adaptor subunit [Eubacterium sp.]